MGWLTEQRRGLHSTASGAFSEPDWLRIIGRRGPQETRSPCYTLYPGLEKRKLRRCSLFAQWGGGLAGLADNGLEFQATIALGSDLFEGASVFRFAPTLQLLEQRHVGRKVPEQWLWDRLYERKHILRDVALASFVANVIAVVVSLFALQVYDRVIPSQNQATLWVLALGASIGILFEFLLKSARSGLIDQSSKELDTIISGELFQKLLGARMDQRSNSPGALVHIAREFQGVREFFSTATVGAVVDLPFVFIFLGVIYLIAGKVAWIVATGTILMVLASLVFRRKMTRLSENLQAGASTSSRLLAESTYGAESVKSARLEPWLQANWEEASLVNAELASQQRHLSANLTLLSASIQQTTYIAAIIGGVYLLFAGQFSMGSIMAISILSNRTLGPMAQLANIIARWNNMKSALNGINMIMEAEQERTDDKNYIRKPVFSGQMEMEKVSFSYSAKPGADLDIPKLALPRGTRIALLGENGSGKSTLLKLLSGLYAPTQGNFRADGIDLRQLDPADVRSNIGYLPQEIRLFKGTLRDNLRTGASRFSDEKLFSALEFAGLRKFVSAQPEGLDLQIHDGGEGLSGGQRMAVGLARIYLIDPPIVLMDEPTAFLDQKSEVNFVQRFEEWSAGRTCVIATHRPAILSQVERIAILQNGRLMMEGKRDKVLSHLQGKGSPSATQESTTKNKKTPVNSEITSLAS